MKPKSMMAVCRRKYIVGLEFSNVEWREQDFITDGFKPLQKCLEDVEKGLDEKNLIQPLSNLR